MAVVVAENNVSCVVNPAAAAVCLTCAAESIGREGGVHLITHSVSLLAILTFQTLTKSVAAMEVITVSPRLNTCLQQQHVQRGQ